MGTSMSNPGEPAQDNGLCPVPTAIEIAKAIVRSAHPDSRYRLWEALIKGIDEAKDSARVTGEALPWETPGEIAYIGWPDFQDAVADALNIVVEEVSERRRLVYVARDAYNDLTARGTARPLRAGKYGVRVCARPGCGQRFTAKSSRHIWHSASCRASAHKAARRAAEAATGEVLVT